MNDLSRQSMVNKFNIAQNSATHPGLKCRVRARFEFNQAARWSNNKENDQKMADKAYLFRVYVLHTFVT